MLPASYSQTQTKAESAASVDRGVAEAHNAPIIGADEIKKLELISIFLSRLERSAARRILTVLDLSMEPGPKREAVRTEVLETLAHLRREIEKWHKSELEATPPETAKD